MNPGPVVRAVTGGLTRRRVQTTVIALVLLISTSAAVLAGALLVDSNDPFDHAFAGQHGAQLTATVDQSLATPVQLAATTRLPQVSAAAGPFATAAILASWREPDGFLFQAPPMTLAGRASPGGALDDVTLYTGHWPRQPGQIVESSSWDSGNVPVGARLTVTGVPGAPTLTVVGVANSVTGSADAWALPAEIPALRAPATPASAEMLYRFRDGGSSAGVVAGTAAVTGALPAGAVTGTQSWLAGRTHEQEDIGLYLPFVVAFGILGLVLSALIVANVVSSAVAAGYSRIGILKSIGFTPRQIVAAYTSQGLIPALAGCLGGVVVGNVLAAPLLARTAYAYEIGHLGVAVWVDVAIPVALCCVTAVAAVIPATRAGRLSAVQAIAAGRAPRTGRGYAAHRVLGRLTANGLTRARPVTIGLAAPFARPARAAVTVVAVGLGAITVTFAVGLAISLNRAEAGLSLSDTEQIAILAPLPSGPAAGLSGPPLFTAGQQAAVQAALAAQPGTLHSVAETDTLQATVPGLPAQISLTAFRGDARWTGYPLISGHWFTGPGQVVVPSGFLTATGTAVGDPVTIDLNGRRVTVRIVGNVFKGGNQGLKMLTDWQTVAAAAPGLKPDQYDIGLRPGASAAAYANALQARLGTSYGIEVNAGSSKTIKTMLALVGALTLLLAFAAALGVLNTVVLHTRERVHDLGIFKAIGMTPRQAIAMVVCWVAGTGLLAGVIAVPAGIALQRSVLPRMAAAAGSGVPASVLDVYAPWLIAILALAGLVIAVAGALIPAGWAARTRTAAALRAE